MEVEVIQVLETIGAVGVTLLILQVAGGLGRALVQHLLPKWEQLSAPERITGEALLGLGLLSPMILLVGLFWLHRISVAALLLVIAAVTVRYQIGWLVSVWNWAKGWSVRRRWERVLAWFIALNLGMMVLMALAPPTRFDALTYHLVGPKLWAQEQQFIALPDNHFFAFPQGLHTLYSAHIALMGGDFDGAATIHALFGLLTLLAVGGYAVRRYNARVGLLAVSFLAATTTLWYHMSTPYVDIGVMAFATLSFIMLDQWRSDQHLSWIIIAGVFAGFAAGVKYEAATWIGLGGLFILIYSLRLGIVPLVRNGALFGFIAVLFVLPWLLRTWAFYDNPAYPLGPPTGQWDDLSNEFYFRENPDFWSSNWWQIATLPLSATFLGFDGAGNFDSTITPLFLMLIPLLAMTWRTFTDDEKRTLRVLLLLAVMTMIVWVVATYFSGIAMRTRRYFYLLPWLAILAAVALDQLRVLPRKGFDFAFIVQAMVALVLTLTFISHVAGTRPKEGQVGIQNTTNFSHFVETRSLEYVAGAIDDTDYLEHNLGWYSVAMERVNQLPDDSNVLFLWETRSLYCDERHLTCEEDTILMRWWHDRRAIGEGNAAEIVDSWRERGITHVLVWETGRDFEFTNTWTIAEEDKAVWEDVPPLLDPIWQGEDIYTLYRMPEVEAGR